jgi:hypothetical protein
MRTLVRGVGALVIVAAIGFVLARSSRGGGGGSADTLPRLSAHAATTSFRVSYPGTWHRLSAPPAGLEPSLSGHVALAPPGTGRELVIGSEPAGGSPAGQLPAPLRAALPSTPAGQIVSLGGQRFVRYPDLAPRRQEVTESVYLLATTSGTIGAVCAAQTPNETFTATCERILGTLRLTSGSALTPGIDTGYALALNGIVTKLNRARSTLGPKLSAGGLQSRARVAQQLAAAHAGAAAAAGRLSRTASGLTAANRALVSALDQTAGAYRELSGAITHRRQAAYRSAQGHLATAALALDAAYARLRGLGYRIS